MPSPCQKFPGIIFFNSEKRKRNTLIEKKLFNFQNVKWLLGHLVPPTKTIRIFFKNLWYGQDIEHTTWEKNRMFSFSISFNSFLKAVLVLASTSFCYWCLSVSELCIKVTLSILMHWVFEYCLSIFVNKILINYIVPLSMIFEWYASAFTVIYVLWVVLKYLHFQKR